MRIAKSLLLMALGATAVLAYQRYSYQLYDAVGDAIKNKARCACDELEDMI